MWRGEIERKIVCSLKVAPCGIVMQTMVAGMLYIA